MIRMLKDLIIKYFCRLLKDFLNFINIYETLSFRIFQHKSTEMLIMKHIKNADY